MLANEPAFSIYNIVEDQVILGGMAGEFVALRNEAIWEAIDRFREKYFIYDELDCFYRVKHIASEIHEIRRQKAEESGGK